MTDLLTFFPSSWSRFLDDATKAEIQKISALLRQAHEPIAPPQHLIFEALRRVAPEEVKVVILGQDPYPGTCVANGLAFATNDSEVPASLKNVFKKVELEFGLNILSQAGNPQELSGWVEQGVLLLNQSLTFCHYRELNRELAKHWRKVVTHLLVSLYAERKTMVFLLWGNKARAFSVYFDPANIVAGPHPSPLSENRFKFFQNSAPHFRIVNEKLESFGIEPVRWTEALPLH